MNTRIQPDNDGVPSPEEEPTYKSGAALGKRYGLGASTIRRMGKQGIFPRRVVSSRFIVYDVALCDAVMAANPEHPLKPLNQEG